MAADPNRDTFLKQLSEMRSLRSQQMQAGGQQMQALGRQTAIMSSMNSNIARQSQQISQMNNSLSRGFSGLAKSVSGLSSAVTRGAASTVAAVSKGAGGAVGSAAAGAGRVSASAISGVASGIVSSLSMVLPAAIAGVLGKSLIWDNIDEDTKKEMGENIGGIFMNVFGDSLKPVTKELKVMTLTLADTLESLGDRIGAVVSGIKGKLPALKDGASQTISNISDKASSAADTVKEKLPRAARVAAIVGGDVKDAAVGAYNIAKGTSGPDVEAIKQGTQVAGGAVVGAGTAKLLKGSNDSAKALEMKAAPNQSPIRKLAMDLLKKDGSKITKASLLSARVAARITIAGGKAALKFTELVKKYKLSQATIILSIAMELIGTYIVSVELRDMVAEGDINTEEADALWEFAKKTATYSFIGSVAGGAVGAGLGGGAASIPLGILGSIGGSVLGAKLSEMTTKLPASLTKEIQEVKKEGGSVTASSILDKRDESKSKQKKKTSATVVSKPSAGATEGGGKGETGNAQKAMEFLMARGWTKEQAAGIVGNLQAESAFDTTAFNKKENAIGIAQWRGVRQQKFKEVFGKDLKDATFEEQLAYVDWELRNGDKLERQAGDLLKDAKTADEAAAIVDKYYERSSGAQLKKRQQTALALVGSGGAQSTMMAEGGGGGGQTAGLQSDQVSAGQKPTAGMNVSQKMDYYRSQSDEDGAQASSTPKPNEQKKPGMFDSFKNAFSSDSFDKLTGDLQKGVEDLMSFDITSKKEAAAGASAPPASGGDTVVNVSGGGGSSPPAYNPVAPAASYQSQFTSLAGIQRTA